MQARLLVLMAAACVIMCPAVFADTTWVAGGAVSGVWSADGSPYMIQGDVHVPSELSLQIGPGVIVFFAARCSLFVDSAARLEAIGAADDSIFFTTDTLLLPERWGGIEFEPYADTCRFEWCVIEHVNQSALDADATPLIIHSTTFRLNHGGQYGVHVGWGFLEMSNCVFESNSASYGGAMVVGTERGTIENCVFRNNWSTTQMGGAIFWYDHFPPESMLLRNCEFHNNHAPCGGAVAQALVYSTLIFENCRFINNTADSLGGAVYLASGYGADFLGCSFDSNFALRGGAMYGPANLVDRCVFAGNGAERGGGVFYSQSDIHATPAVHRSTFVANTASINGAALFLPTTGIVMRSCLIAFNNGSGIGTWPGFSSPLIRFNLMYGNSGGNVFPEHNLLGNSALVNANGDSCDWYYNVIADPQLVDPAAGNYHLLSASPCIDAGDPLSPLDPDSTIADIGAFYYDQTVNAYEQRPGVRQYGLLQNYPNPFNAVTRIEFDLVRSADVTLSVFDITGRRVAMLLDQPLAAGHHIATFDAAGLPSGVYLYRLQAGTVTQVKKMMLLK